MLSGVVLDAPGVVFAAGREPEVSLFVVQAVPVDFSAGGELEPSADGPPVVPLFGVGRFDFGLGGEPPAGGAGALCSRVAIEHAVFGTNVCAAVVAEETALGLVLEVRGHPVHSADAGEAVGGLVALVDHLGFRDRRVYRGLYGHADVDACGRRGAGGRRGGSCILGFAFRAPAENGAAAVVRHCGAAAGNDNLFMDDGWVF